MRNRVSRAYRATLASGGSMDRTRLVLVIGAVMIATQLCFRAWAIYPAWFFLDDYNLLHEARSSGLSLDYLMTPYNGHLMPGGRFLVWLADQPGGLNWTIAATTTLVAQTLSSVAAFWMLTTLFGARLAVLAPLGLYLTSALTMPAFMWWAAALNLVPLQATFFITVGLWVTYLRTQRARPLVGAAVSIAAGLTFDVKGILVVPVLAFIAIAYFAQGPVTTRLRLVFRSYRAGVIALSLLTASYLAYYMLRVPQITSEPQAERAWKLAGTMLGAAWPSALVGGPWRWDNFAPPTAYAHPPGVLVSFSWVVIALVVCVGALQRTRTLRTWVLLGGYLVVLLGLLTSTRGAKFGSAIGFELRYLTDATCVVVLCLGLVFLPLAGAPEGSQERSEPGLRSPVPLTVVGSLMFVVFGSGLASSASYARIWHSDNASDPYMHNLQRDLRAQGQVDLAETVVPEDVLSNLTAPMNTTRRLAFLTGARVDFPAVSPLLSVVGPDGRLHKALIQPGVTSRPGPDASCGWKVEDEGLTIPLEARPFDWTWWIRIGYLASAGSPVTVSAAGTTIDSSISRGLNSLFVRIEGSFDSVSISGLEPGTTLCVDTIEVGQPVPGGPQ